MQVFYALTWLFGSHLCATIHDLPFSIGERPLKGPGTVEHLRRRGLCGQARCPPRTSRWRHGETYLFRLYHALGKIYTENKKIFYFFCFFSDTHSQIVYGCSLTRFSMRGEPMLRFHHLAYSPNIHQNFAYTDAIEKTRTPSEGMNICSHVLTCTNAAPLVAFANTSSISPALCRKRPPCENRR